jgi:hypothetical protein
MWLLNERQKPRDFYMPVICWRCESTDENHDDRADNVIRAACLRLSGLQARKTADRCEAATRVGRQLRRPLPICAPGTAGS